MKQYKMEEMEETNGYYGDLFHPWDFNENLQYVEGVGDILQGLNQHKGEDDRYEGACPSSIRF